LPGWAPLGYLAAPCRSTEPDALTCPRCLTEMKHVRVIAHLDELPEIHIFYCAPFEHVETIKLKRAA
jgi:hypothetical protein